MVARSVLLILCTTTLLIQANDRAFLSAMKSLIWGAENTTHPDALHDSSDKSKRSFSQYHTAARSTSGSSCTLPQQIGTGPYRIPRWYYNPARQRCELFYWSGCCGNGNNFQTFQSCQQVCEVNADSLQWLPSVSQVKIVASINNNPIPQYQNGNCGCNRVVEQPQYANPGCSCCSAPFNQGTGDYMIPRYYFEPADGRCKPFLYRGNGGSGNLFESLEQCQNQCHPQPFQQVDPCTQEHEPGVGSLQLNRYFFNKNTKLCEQFVYFGSAGNRNNYQTLSECQKECPESPNPCAVQNSGPLQKCSQNSNTCGNGYYCHIGANAQTTVCCPKPAAVDKCQQPLNIGIGNANVQRWYFNPLTQQCQTCVYKGLQGNENNFLSRQECENSCLVNPCKISTPYRSQGVTVQCSALNPNVCPAGHYCHVGADQTTSVCCQALGRNPCDEPMSKGEGVASLTRFFYDPIQRKCLTFNYLGAKGNTNNFLSKEQCESACPVWINPCAVGIPILGVDQKPTKCNHVTPCPSSYFCHLGFDDTTTVCCISQQTDPCTQPIAEGRGTQPVQRWFYNSNTRQCQPFSYRGLGGNENNFLLREHCEATCPVWINPCQIGEPILRDNRPTPCDLKSEDSCPLTHWCHPGPDPSTTVCCPGRSDPCMLARVEGDGPLSLQRYYFDASTKKCLPFIFRGLKGNANNFLSEDDCVARCPVQVDPCPLTFSSLQHSVKLMECSPTHTCPDKQWCHVGPTKETTVCCPNAVNDPCKAPPRNPGIGEYKTTRWAFDPSTRRCVPFEYRGMKGNANNFISRETCEGKCPVFQNPCKVGDPYQLNGRYQVCNPASPCPSRHFCHIGEAANYCCPMLGGDPCGQPMDRGYGSSQLQRWYWNVNSQQCQPFSYCGTKGTQNNFLSKSDCDKTCYELDNPCAGGDPLMGMDNRPLTCSSDQSAVCGNANWCHIGGSQSTTVCCPRRVDGSAICALPMVSGDGEYSLNRWYYDQSTRTCSQFIYKGRLGNQNNFLTQQACENQCKVFVNVCPVGSPLLDQTNNPIPCTFGSDSCGSSHWCHLGLVPDEYQCCPGTPTIPGACTNGVFEEGVESDRAEPAERWYFDKTDHQCKQFTFNGRKGSQNNFLTKEDCEATCNVWVNVCPIGSPLLDNSGVPLTCTFGSDTCGSSHWCHLGLVRDEFQCCPGTPTNPGACTNGTQTVGTPTDKAMPETRWFYDKNSKQCKTFVFNGRRGSQNNFLSQEDCEATCDVWVNVCPVGSPLLNENGSPIVCTFGSDNCGSSHWCHLGLVPEENQCCPGAPTNPGACTNGTFVEGNPTDKATPAGRWFYNSIDHRCEEFTFNGRQGSQNNFLTREDCEGTCPVWVNVCPVGSPLLDNSGKPLLCTFGSDTCGSSHWCHLGLVPDEYQCCPGTPTNPGACTNGTFAEGVPSDLAAPEMRWYYDNSDQQCKQFTFQGRQGSQNNFLTQEDCAAICDVFENPCNQPITLPATLCSANSSNCGPSMWCHIGLTPQSTVCCPSEGDPCQLPLNRGQGSQFADRWYYNIQTGSCQAFTYAGMKGNQNNFLDRQSCEERCGPNPCFEGRPFIGVDGRPQTCTATANMNTCPANHWCHIGSDMSMTVCCPGASTNVCNLPMSTGEGNYNLDRYYFDSNTRTCRPFKYNGLKGNQNNFLTLRACQISCQPFDNPCIGQPAYTSAGQVVFCSATNKDACPVNFWCHLGATPETTVCCPGATNPCSVPLAPGTGNAGLSRYYYNADERTCEAFQYNGKRGNQNNFESQEDCDRTCPVFNDPCEGNAARNENGDPIYCDATAPLHSPNCPKSFFCLPGDTSVVNSGVCCPSRNVDPCAAPMFAGNGTEFLPRFYYSSSFGECFPFEYRGKWGNENNFLTKQLCEENCAPVTNVCFGGEPPLFEDEKIVQCSSFNKCPEEYYCHLGENSRTTVCCRDRGNPCNQQLMTGVGPSNLTRYFYDSVSDDCLSFEYSGLQGNQNNFATRQQCQIACPGFRGYCPHGRPHVIRDPIAKSSSLTLCGVDIACPGNNVCHVTKRSGQSVCCPDPALFCLHDPDVGPCMGNSAKYAYNKEKGICEKFEYGEELCLLSIDRGACTGRVTRYAFDRRSNTCTAFEYTGCGGNLNNFVSYGECEETCSKVTFRR